MTTRRRNARAKKDITTVEQPIDHDGHEVVEEIVKEPEPPRLPQSHQVTIMAKRGGPHEPTELVGHVRFSEGTGVLTANPTPKYGADLDNFIKNVLVVRTAIGEADIAYSPQTLEWLKNLHKGELPRYWVAEEIKSLNEI